MVESGRESCVAISQEHYRLPSDTRLSGGTIATPTIEVLAISCEYPLHEAPKESGRTLATERLDWGCFQFLVELSDRPPINTRHESQKCAMQLHLFRANIKAKFRAGGIESQIQALEQNGMSDPICGYIQYALAKYQLRAVALPLNGSPQRVNLLEELPCGDGRPLGFSPPLERPSTHRDPPLVALRHQTPR